MSFSKFINNNEKVFIGTQDIKYFFWPSETPSDHLIVTFSGFHGKESDGVSATYNYVKPLSKIDCNRLFILDSYNGHPCYYLGKDKTLDYEVSVATLIYSIANQNNIPYKNIITCGSSKGGTAALYFGIKYGFGHIVTGGFQVKVGDYIYSVNDYTRKNVLKLITGGTTERHKEYLDDFFLEFINTCKVNTNIYIHGGKGDLHYINHVSLFTETMKKRGIPFNLDLKNYSSHSEIAPYFSDFILEKIPEITGNLLIKDTIIEKNEKNELLVSCTVPKHLKDSIHYAYHIYKDDRKEPVEKINYSRNSSLSYKVNSPGNYRVRVFVRNQNQRIATGTPSILI